MGSFEGRPVTYICLNESPSEKEGKSHCSLTIKEKPDASMKVPPKRKGNTRPGKSPTRPRGLNESPSEKEGKWLPETSPQPCGRNGCFARTSRRLHAKLYTPTASTPA